MKHIRYFAALLLPFLCLLTTPSYGQNIGEPMRFRNGSFKAQSNIAHPASGPDTIPGSPANGKDYLIIQFDHIPGKAERASLAGKGVRLFDYIPGRAFMAEVQPGIKASELRQFAVSGFYRMPADLKIAPDLKKANSLPPDRLIGISYFGSITEEAVRNEITLAGAVIVPTRIRPHNTLFIHANGKVLDRIAALPYIDYIAPQQMQDRTLNYNNRAAHSLDALNDPMGRNLQGQGVVVGIGDDSDPYTHTDFTGRQIDRFAASSGTHGVHTSGTLAGGGIVNPKYRGMAPKATIISQYYNDILVNANTYIADYDMVLTNNSYTAYDPGCGNNGQYDFLSNYVDAQLLDHPTLLHTFASGNDGLYSCSPYSTQLATVKSGYQSAKNVLTVGNLNNGTNTILNTSSSGPVGDGRIKPELVAGGAGIISTFPNNTYQSQTGTSMASPTVTGALALLVQRYRQLHAGMDPPAALLKAIVCNSATDMGRPGPDFLYGFGSLNARTAVLALENNNYFMGSVSQSGSDTYTISGIPAGLQQIKIMLYWTDRPAALYAATALVNDLDLVVTAPDATQHLPLVLDASPAHVSDNAMEGTDHLNNIEQVVIDHPPGGTFTIHVNGSGIPDGPQPYAIAYQTIQPSVTLEYPSGNETWVPGETEMIRWTAAGGDAGAFTLEYSSDNGSTYSTINNAVPAASRLYSWTVPAATSQALIRITRNGTAYGDSSGHTFIILGQPAVTGSNPCQGYAQLAWSAIPSATGYDIMRLTGDSMQKISSTTTTGFLLGNLKRDSSYWLAVRATNGAASGRRSVAVKIIPSGGACSLTSLDNDQTIDSLILPSSTGRMYTSSQLGSAMPVRVELKNLGTIPANTPFTISCQVNEGPVVTEICNAVLPPNGAYTYTFANTFDFSLPGSYRLSAWVTYPSDPQRGNDTLHALIRQLTNDPLTLTPAYIQGFESAPPAIYQSPVMGLAGLDNFDFSSSDANGRLRTFINSGFARTGSHCATLDQTHYNALTTTDSLTGTFNLSGYSGSDQLWLSFYYRNQGIDSAFPGNRIWIRGNDQAAWIPVHTLDISSDRFGIYQPSPAIDITGILKNAVPLQTVSSSFQVRFGQQGHTSANSVTTDGNLDDGYSFDDITLTHSDHDAGILSLQAPSFSDLCGLSDAETVTVKVRNYNAAPISNVPVSYSINGTTVTEQIVTIGANDSVVYSFTRHADLSAYRQYKITAWVSNPGDNYSANDTLPVITTQTTPVISSYPYLEGFETNAGYWYQGGTNSSWQWGKPAKSVISKAAGGINCWTTSLNGNYNDNELSYLYSPCLDLSSLEHPVLSFSHIFHTEDNCVCDFHWVEYSLDGSHWTKLGAAGSGTNWYDNVSLQAWQHAQPRWQVSTYDLPISAARLRLRFVMFSDGGTNEEGVGIDDIHIYERASIYNGVSVGSGLIKPVSGSDWVDFEAGGQRIASINAGGQDLGATDCRVFFNSGAVRYDSSQYYLDRNIVVRPSTVPAGSVSVRYYFTDAELRRMMAATGCPACTNLTDAYEAGITQYSSRLPAEEDSTLTNDSSGIFRFFRARQDLRIVPFGTGYYAEYKVNGFSEFWINGGGGSGSQPIHPAISFFAVLRTGNAASLQWSTTDNAHAARFVIERSGDGTTFYPVDSLTALADPSLASYRYIDDHPLPGTSWYRIKLVDYREDTSYSPVRILSDPAGGPVISLYPNPIRSGNLNILSTVNCRYIALTDAAGKTILQSNVHGYLNTLNITGLAGGVYFVTIDTDHGRKVEKLFVK